MKKTSATTPKKPRKSDDPPKRVQPQLAQINGIVRTHLMPLTVIVPGVCTLQTRLRLHDTTGRNDYQRNCFDLGSVNWEGIHVTLRYTECLQMLYVQFWDYAGQRGRAGLAEWYRCQVSWKENVIQSTSILSTSLTDAPFKIPIIVRPEPAPMQLNLFRVSDTPL